MNEPNHYVTFAKACKRMGFALSHSNTLRILYYLRNKEMDVRELAKNLNKSVRMTQYALCVGTKAGLITTRRKGVSPRGIARGVIYLYSLNRRAVRIFIYETLIKELLNESREDYTIQYVNLDKNDVRQAEGKSGVSCVWGRDVGEFRPLEATDN